MAQPRRLRGGLSADLSLSEPRRREAALVHGAIIFDSKDSEFVTKRNPKPEYARLGLFARYYSNVRSSKLSGHGAEGAMKWPPSLA
jgi:hypothetical protein